MGLPLEWCFALGMTALQKEHWMTNSPDSVLNALKQNQIIGILRLNNEADAIWVGNQLHKGGIQSLEVTWTNPNPTNVLEQFKANHPNALLGAGTILSKAEAIEAMSAGASFLATPWLDLELIQFGLEKNILVLPGCLTPTEIYQAHREGAKAIKVFPLGSMGGESYLKSVLAPFPNLKLIPSGGIDLNSVQNVLNVGAWAVGIGTPLYPEKAWIENRDSANIQAHVNRLTYRFSAARN